MQKTVQQKFSSDAKMYKFLKENSYWIKELNRNANSYENFVKEMKEKYKIRASDKITDVIDNIDIISNVLNVLK